MQATAGAHYDPVHNWTGFWLLWLLRLSRPRAHENAAGGCSDGSPLAPRNGIGCDAERAQRTEYRHQREQLADGLAADVKHRKVDGEKYQPAHHQSLEGNLPKQFGSRGVRDRRVRE